MDIQIVYIFLLSVITIIVAFAGAYFVLILKEFRITIQKINGMLDNVQNVSKALSSPLTILTGIMSGIKLVKNFKEKEA